MSQLGFGQHNPVLAVGVDHLASIAVSTPGPAHSESRVRAWMDFRRELHPAYFNSGDVVAAVAVPSIVSNDLGPGPAYNIPVFLVSSAVTLPGVCGDGGARSPDSLLGPPKGPPHATRAQRPDLDMHILLGVPDHRNLAREILRWLGQESLSSVESRNQSRQSGMPVAHISPCRSISWRAESATCYRLVGTNVL